MNRKVKEMGLSSTEFRNAHGLSAEGQITTAREIARFARLYLLRFPMALQYHSMQEYTFNDIKQKNRNRLLLKDKSIDGLKTGYVEAAGHHLAATSSRNGMRMLAVIMGASSPAVREQEAIKLLEYGFQHFTLVEPFPWNTPVATLRVWKGVKEELPVYPANTAVLLVKKSEEKNVRWEVDIPHDVTAPIRKGQTFGKVTFYVEGNPEKEVSVVGHEAIEKAGWIKRFWHGALRIPYLPWRWILGALAAAGLIAAVVVGFLRRSSVRFRRKSRLD
jgi:D-alanyl-D-alanine carboxypeptidase (penicillin-binding protein 5/6)